LRPPSIPVVWAREAITHMNKLFGLLAAISLPVCLCAEEAAKPVPKEISSLLAEYQKEFNKAKEPSDKVLRSEGTKLAAGLVGSGNADGAKLVGEQIDDKVGGKRVTNVDAALVKLFGLYDSAVLFAAKPIREKYNQRVDALLHTPMGKDMVAVVALGEAKKVIAGELPAVAASTAATKPAATSPKGLYTPTPPIVTNLARGRKVLEDLVEGKSWTYSWTTNDDLMTFEKRGKLRWFRGSKGIQEDKWEAGDEAIIVGDNYCEIRFDASGTFGEVMFNSTKKRLRMTPSTQAVPKK
jgi:hypothetical protein